MLRTVITLLAAVTLFGFAPGPARADAVTDAMALADEGAELLRFLEEDARFLAQGQIELGDSDGWHRYTAFASEAGSVAWHYEGYARDLARGLPLSVVDQSYAMNRRSLSQLALAAARLRNPPDYFAADYARFTDIDRAFAAVVTLPPDDPNAEPDVPGRHECVATWSMNGTTMRWRGQGASRNAAKAEALRQCTATMGRHCRVTSCAPLRRYR